MSFNIEDYLLVKEKIQNLDKNTISMIFLDLLKSQKIDYFDITSKYIEFQKNDNREVLSILEKLAKNDFSYKLYNWHHFTDPYIIDNKMGIIYAWR